MAEATPRKRDVTLAIFMEGTGNPVQQITTQIALLSRICNGTPLRPDQVKEPMRPTPGDYKLSFNGCGVSHGFRGVLFAHGLKEQVALIRSYIAEFLRVELSVTVNFVGLSRGGIGGLYMAQELADLPIDKVILNMLLFDPVPGNLVWMSRYADLAGVMNANQAMDVSPVPNLGRILVLYPYEPLPALAFHAPLVAKFPAGCQLEQDVILGCHQGALQVSPRPDTCLAFARIRDFLIACGSSVDTCNSYARGLDLQPQKLAEMLQTELACNAPMTRITHAPVPGVQIVRHPTGQYLDRYHQALLQQLGVYEPPGGGKPGCPLYMLDLVYPEG